MSGVQFLVRSVRDTDLDALYKLSTTVRFINLPADRQALEAKIKSSIDSFSGQIADKFSREYLLVLEDLKQGTVIGTSGLIARHGSPQSPHMYFELREVQRYSQTIHTGFIQKLLRLKFDYDGPTEIAGLTIAPELRNNPAKLGRQLSYARFALVKARRRWFKNFVLSELMPPLTETGESILWEALGRRFTNLPYLEADALSRKNKEFVTSLFPRGDIHTCLLSAEARDAIGKVGAGAQPVKHMLEKLGFKWRGDIDPFDGGPHYWAETNRIEAVRSTKRIKLASSCLKSRSSALALVSKFIDGEFFCLQVAYDLVRGQLSVSKQVHSLLQLDSGESVFFTPL